MKNRFVNQYLEYYKNNPEKYWFKAKLYGYGWVPVRWQGWVVVLVFITLMTVNAFRLDITNNQATGLAVLEFVLETWILALVLIYISYKTGERARFRWGLKSNGEDNLIKLSKGTRYFLLFSFFLAIAIMIAGIVILIFSLKTLR